MQFRPGTAVDHDAVDALHRAAFPTDDEARLVDALRESDAFVPALSIVAVEDDASAEDATTDRVLGHVLLTEVDVAGTDDALALAPVAVHPARQNEGIGTALVEHALDRCRDLDYAVVVLHGDLAYYSRFGFEPATRWGLQNAFDLPDDDFQALALLDDVDDDVSGAVSYPTAFDAL
ncbi:GNAT family N-acetyltransferase [Halorubellus salinus]|uniref:GNAT family N-acetyltransferase n=1 Tax=Halorubellus salinus TaxID=755309 RepID=UPI001D070229|nr:N-acetyltransferase [Halorubellus salinus]